jgi:hypothetical protein
MVSSSPALVARERQVFAEHTAELAVVLAEQTHAAPEDLVPWVVANALMGVHRAVLDSVRRRALDGQPNPSLARDVRFQAERALGLLAEGLGGYTENDRRPRPAKS